MTGILKLVTIRADEVRFRERDVAWAVGGAALLGAFFGAMYLVIPTVFGNLTGTASTTPELLGLFLIFAIPIGAVIGLGGAAGAAVAYSVARGGKAKRAATFAVLMAIGAGLGAATAVVLSLVVSDADHYNLTHPGTWVPSAAALFAGGSLPTALIVPLAFRGRARHPIDRQTSPAPQNAAPAG